MIEKLPNFIIIGQEDWDEIWRRNQFLIAGLARRFPSSKFIFIEMPFDLSYSLRTGQLFRKGSQARHKLVKMRSGILSVNGFSNIYTLVLPKIFPAAIGIGEQLNCVLQAKLIGRALNLLDIQNTIFWTQNPVAAPLIEHIGEQPLIYDITDDWANLQGISTRFLERVQASEKILLERANCIITCSQYLYENKAVGATNKVLIPNGVDVKHYARIGEPDFPVASPLVQIPRPIIGYTGSLHSARLDIELILHIAQALPQVSFVFIGPNFLSKEVMTRLRQFKNIQILGPIPYQELPTYMQGFDGLIIPHVISNFTESLNPLKLFEYLAAGLPVVATNLAGVRDYSDLFVISESPSQFVSAIHNIVNHKGNYDRERARDIARTTTWEMRVDMLVETLKQTGLYGKK